MVIGGRSVVISLLSVATAISGLVLISLRDPGLAGETSRFPSGKSAELALCTELPQCFRLGSLLTDLVRSPIESLLSSQFIARDTQSALSLQSEWRSAFFSLLFDYGLRITCLSIVVIVVLLLLRPHIVASLFLVAGFFLISSGAIVLSALAVVSSYFPGLVPDWRLDVLITVSTRFILPYDYFAIAAITSMPLALRAIGKRESDLTLMQAGLLSLCYSLIWEYTGLLFAIAYLIYARSWRKIKPLVVLIGAAAVVPISIWIHAKITSIGLRSEPDLLNTWTYYRESNLLYWKSLIEQIAISIPLLVLLGAFVGLVVALRNSTIALASDTIRVVWIVYILLLLGLVVAFATSGLASEFTRQSLPLQALTPVASFLAVLSLANRRRRGFLTDGEAHSHSG